MPPSVTIIGMNYRPETTGNAPYTGSLAEGLQRRGWGTQVVTTYPHYPSWRLSSEDVRWSSSSIGSGVRVDRKLHYVPRVPRGLRRLLGEISFGVRAATARWGRPDVVLLVSPALFSSAVCVLRSKVSFRRRPMVLWVQDIYTLGLEETGQGGRSIARIMAAVERWVMQQVDEVVVIHERFAEVLAERLGVPGDKVSVVRNWTHLPEPAPIDRAAVRESFGWGTDEVIVLHAGNMGVKQGLENVVEAGRIAQDRGRAVRFVLLGGGSERAHLVALARGVAAVEFLDSLDEERYQTAMAAADVLLVNEKAGVATMAVPSKLTSYFSSGRPVLAATDRGSITESEVLRSGGGAVVAAADPAALLERAEEIGSDAAAAAELGERGRTFRREHLTEEAGIDRYAEVLAVHAAWGARTSVFRRRPRSQED